MIAKLFVLIALLGAVFTAFRWYGRLEQFRTRREREKAAADQPRQLTEDMVKCRVCGVYVPSQGARDCGYADCPHRR